MRGHGRWATDGAVLLGLAAVAVVKLWPLITPLAASRLYLGGDFGLAVEPYFYHQLKRGILPLWDVTLGTGSPFLGAGTHHPMFLQAHLHLFYPLNLVWLGLAERREAIPHLVLQYHHAFHYALAGGLTYAYGRQLGLGRGAASVAGIAFMLSGFLLAHIQHWTLVDTIVWLPAALACLARCEATGRLRWAALAGVSLGVAFLAGHPQMFYYVALATVALALTAIGRRVAAGARWAGFAGQCAVAAAIAFGVAAVQLIPSWDVTVGSHRAALGYDWKTIGSLPPAYLLGVLMPWGLTALSGWAESASEYSLYPGLLTLVLAGHAVARRWDWRVGYHAVLALGGLLLAFGDHYGLYRAAYDLLPGLRLFRIPARSLGLVSFALAVLAGLGAQALLAEPDRAEGLRRAVRRLLLVLAAGAPAVTAMLLWSRGRPDADGFENLAGQYVLMVLTFTAVAVVVGWPGDAGSRTRAAGLVGVLALDLLFGSYPVAPSGRNPDAPAPREAAWVDAIARVREPLRLVRGRSIHPQALYRHGWGVVDGESTFAPPAFLDLYAAAKANPRLLDLLNVRFVVAGSDAAPRIPAPEERVTLWPDAVRRIPVPDAGPARQLALDTHLVYGAERRQGEPVATVHVVGVDGAALALPLRAGLETAEWALDRPGSRPAHGRPPVARSWPVAGEGFEGHTYRAQLPLPAGFRPAQLLLERTPGAGALVIERVALDGRALPLQPRPELRRVAAGLYENAHVLPRAFLVRRARQVPPGRLLEELRDLDPALEVLVTEPPPAAWRAAPRPGGPPPAAVQLVEYTPARVRAAVDTPEPAVLVLSDTFDPRWRAWDGGRPVTIHRADHALRAVFLDAGRHEIEFRYRQPSVLVGLAVTATTVAALGAGAVLAVTRRRGRGPA